MHVEGLFYPPVLDDRSVSLLQALLSLVGTCLLSIFSPHSSSVPDSCFSSLNTGEQLINMVLLAALWLSWCAIHSFLIDPTVIGLMKTRLPGVVRLYRILYNGWSLITLLLLALYTHRVGGEVVFAWQGLGSAARLLLLATALLLFFGGAKRYDMQSFFGMRQLREGRTQVLLTAAQDFIPSGVFGVTRHPWYLGSFLGIWSIFAEYPLSIFTAAVILSLYLVVGTLLEERKIIRDYGDSYRRYQQQVSMLFPWKWLKSRIKL